MSQQNKNRDTTMTDKELTNLDPEFEAKRQRHLLDQLVGAPHECGSTIFWQYFLKKARQLIWYCYHCTPPFEPSAILAIYNDGQMITDQNAAIQYYLKDLTRPSQRRRARKPR